MRKKDKLNRGKKKKERTNPKQKRTNSEERGKKNKKTLQWLNEKKNIRDGYTWKRRVSWTERETKRERTIRERTEERGREKQENITMVKWKKKEMDTHEKEGYVEQREKKREGTNELKR